jgi:hypothetical protein
MYSSLRADKPQWTQHLRWITIIKIQDENLKRRLYLPVMVVIMAAHIYQLLAAVIPPVKQNLI